MIWEGRQFSDRARKLLLAAQQRQRQPGASREVAVAWLEAEGVQGDLSVFVAFQDDFGGLSYPVLDDVVSLGLWRYSYSGELYTPYGGMEEGLFWTSCGGYKFAQGELILRQDGCILEPDDVVASSIEKFIEDHAMFAAIYERPLRFRVDRMILSESRGRDVEEALKLAPVSDATDLPYFSWWEGEGVFVREGVYVNPEPGRKILHVFSAELGVLERVREVVSDAIVSGVG